MSKTHRHNDNDNHHDSEPQDPILPLPIPEASTRHTLYTAVACGWLRRSELGEGIWEKPDGTLFQSEARMPLISPGHRRLTIRDHLEQRRAAPEA